MISEEEVAEIYKITRGITCNNLCKGTGTIIESTAKGVLFNDCSCVKEFQWIYKMVRANIPKKYWDFTLRNLIKDFIRDNNQALALIDGYVNQIDSMIKEGVGLYIEGIHGLAKTALSCYIIKQFLNAGKEAYFIRMSNLTHLVFESIRDDEAKAKLLWIRKKTQLLVVDEIEKDYKIADEATFSGAAISEIFDDIYETKKCLIITSNVTKEKLAKTHAESVVDRIMELVDIPLVGKGYRGTVDKKSLIVKGIKK